MKKDILDHPIRFYHYHDRTHELFDKLHYTLDDVLDPPGRVIAGPIPTEGLLRSLREETRVDKIYSLIDDDDIRQFSIPGFRAKIQSFGFETSHYPVQDDNIPHESQLRAFIEEARKDLIAGKTIYVHCIAGLGRTSVMVGCLWIDRTGSDPDEVIAEMRRRRPGSVRTETQAHLIRSFRYDSNVTPLAAP